MKSFLCRGGSLLIPLCFLSHFGCQLRPEGVPPPLPPKMEKRAPLPPSPSQSWKNPAPLGTHISESEYTRPPQAVVDLLESEGTPRPLVHAKSRRLVQLYEQHLVPMNQLSRPRLGLAGLTVDTGNRTRIGAPLFTRFRVLSLEPGAPTKDVTPPPDALFSDVSFSPDGGRLAVSLVYSDRIDLGIYDIEEDELFIVADLHLSAFWGRPCQFLGNNDLLCKQTASASEPPLREVGPNIQELRAGAAPIFTFRNLLKNRNDDALFEHYGQIQHAHVTLKDEGAHVEAIGPKGMLTSASVSPDKRYIMVTRVARPYPRRVPAERFPQDLEVYEMGSDEPSLVVSSEEGTVSSTSLPLGPRLAAWDRKYPHTLLYVLRFVDPFGKIEDTLLSSSEQIGTPPVALVERLRRVASFGRTSRDTLYLTDLSANGRGLTSYLVDDSIGKANRLHEVVRGPDGDPTADISRAYRVGGDTGPVWEDIGPNGKRNIYFSAESVSLSGRRPELIELSLTDGAKKRIWQSNPGEHAEVKALLDPSKYEYLLSVERPNTPPHFIVSQAGRRRPLSRPLEPHLQLEGVTRRIVHYERHDGVKLSATLYLPRGAKLGRPLPTVLWIYPRVVADANEAEKAPEISFRYFDIRGPSRYALLTQGYALLDDPGMPIIVNEKTDHVSYLEQLEKSASAAIDHLVQLGISERQSVAVIGRSYGAFAAANLLAHTSLFRAGIAMSGAYNRTLTPFGFASETRTFWESTEAYAKLSPFFFAHRLKAPILLMHGEEDDNPGTPVLQSETFYAALVGNGVRARYVSFPFECHHFRGHDTVLHASAEIISFLKEHLSSP